MLKLGISATSVLLMLHILSRNATCALHQALDL